MAQKRNSGSKTMGIPRLGKRPTKKTFRNYDEMTKFLIKNPDLYTMNTRYDPSKGWIMEDIKSVLENL
jgi:hypothetical protein